MNVEQFLPKNAVHAPHNACLFAEQVNRWVPVSAVWMMRLLILVMKTMDKVSKPEGQSADQSDSEEQHFIGRQKSISAFLF